jgi:YggT family protein
MCGTCFLLVFLEAFVNIAAQALVLAIFVRVIMSWVPIRLPLGLNELVWNVTEPVLSPIRRYMPIAGGMDFSPFIALLLIQIALSIILRLLPPAIPNPPF